MDERRERRPTRRVESEISGPKQAERPRILTLEEVIQEGWKDSTNFRGIKVRVDNALIPFQFLHRSGGTDEAPRWREERLVLPIENGAQAREWTELVSGLEKLRIYK